MAAEAKTPDRNDLIIFLGSGVSTACELPDVRQLQESMLNGNWWRRGEELYDEGIAPDYDKYASEWVRRIQQTLRIISRHQTEYIASRIGHSNGIDVNYEQLFYLVTELGDEGDGVKQSFLTYHGRNQLIGELYQEGLLQSIPQGHDAPIEAEELFRQCEKFIRCVVWHKLNIHAECNFLTWLPDLMESKTVSRIHIVTTNHDRIIEKYCANNNIPLQTGFQPLEEAPSSSGIIPEGFVPSLFTNNDRLRLLKLHGSVSWFQNDPAWPFHVINYTGNPSQDTFDHPDVSTLLRRPPLFLQGAWMKSYEYTKSIFGEMHFRFQEALKSSAKIIMSGYGWQDEVINFHLLDDWLRNPSNRIVLFYERGQFEKERERCLNLNLAEFKQFESNGKMVLMNKWMSDVTASDLLP